MNEMNTRKMAASLAVIKRTFKGAQPRAAIICGSGWGGIVEAFEIRKTLPYEKLSALGKPGVAGHAGRLVWGTLHGVETLIFQGRRHYYEGEGWTPVAFPLYVLKKLGVPVLLLTNAAGAIRADLKPGHLMILRDHINFIGSNPLVGPHDPFWGERFPDQSYVYSNELRKKLGRAATQSGMRITEGVYLAASGPVYETPAEIQMFRTLGADAVGMSTVPEALLAAALKIEVAALSCMSNHAAGIAKHPLSHHEVKETTEAAMPGMRKLVAAFWEELAG